MNIRLFVLVILLSLYFTSWAQKVVRIKNSTDESRQEVVSVPYTAFSKHFGVDTVFTIKDKISGEAYVHQLERMGTAEVQNVLVQVQIAPKSQMELVVTPTAPSAATHKAYARYVPERLDDFAWENDVVAFRMYGKALEGRKDDAQGMDYWAKRTSDMVIDDWYRHGDYHKDHGQGLDYYTVGQTLGAGDIALFFGDEIHYTRHYRRFQILDNGPLRTTFRLFFEPQELAGNTVSLTKTISLDAGKQFNRIEVRIDNKNAKRSPVVIGLAKRDEGQPRFDVDLKEKTLVYWEPNIGNAGHTGTALVFPYSKAQFIADSPKQFLIKTSVKNGQPLVYYNGAAWDRAGKITSADDWEDHVESYAKGMKKPLTVTLR